MEDSKRKYTFKILMLGDSGVGKTCLLQRFLENRYTDNSESTVGIDFRLHTHKLSGHLVDLQLWDTAGEERFRSVGTTYYRGAHGIILVYDTTKRETFNNIDSWLLDIQRHAAEGVNIMIVGNKCDALGQRQVSQQTAAVFAAQLHVPFFEASAKSDLNVQDIFTNMSVMIYNRLIAPRILDSMADSSVVTTRTSPSLTSSVRVKANPAKVQHSSCC
ncbi:uncharacterized protein Dwil_GK20101 [Drosophila willistoni]|uniref:Uncharacterized protein n=1 Tax=Drosophila willistoni TaxID=7260 RepID=B4MT64_DROWI|nr:GTP-binding protein ypt1 [Drosophila willistoni]EDW75303.1 uncharacterized protein Dwil_GK20101 [Drosophila willistoni]